MLLILRFKYWIKITVFITVLVIHKFIILCLSPNWHSNALGNFVFLFARNQAWRTSDQGRLCSRWTTSHPITMMMITHTSVWMGKIAQVFSAALMIVAQGHGVKTGCTFMCPKLTPTPEYSSLQLLASSTSCTGLGTSISYKYMVWVRLGLVWNLRNIWKSFVNSSSSWYCIRLCKCGKGAERFYQWCLYPMMCSNGENALVKKENMRCMWHVGGIKVLYYFEYYQQELFQKIWNTDNLLLQTVCAISNTFIKNICLAIF